MVNRDLLQQIRMAKNRVSLRPTVHCVYTMLCVPTEQGLRMILIHFCTLDFNNQSFSSPCANCIPKGQSLVIYAHIYNLVSGSIWLLFSMHAYCIKEISKVLSLLCKNFN